MSIDKSYFTKLCYRCGKYGSECVCFKQRDIVGGIGYAEAKKRLDQLIQAYKLGYSDRSAKSVPFQDMDPAEYFEQFLKEPPTG